MARFLSNREAISSVPLAPELLKAGRFPKALEGDMLLVFAATQKTLNCVEEAVTHANFDGDLGIIRLVQSSKSLVLKSGNLYDVPLPGDIHGLGLTTLPLHIICEQLEDPAQPYSQEQVTHSITESAMIEELMASNLGEYITLESLSAILLDAITDQSVLLLAGNGGSACDALEFHNMCLQYARTAGLSLITLPLLDSGYITCVANDWQYDYIFTRGVEGWSSHSTAMLGISTSGNSKNIKDAFMKCKSHDISTILLSGETGGEIRGLSSATILVPSKITHRIQETHDSILRGIVDFIDCIASDVSLH